ncbi:hypothetical protein SDJN03_18679, partial [Cucurbita argyrosperma subsp. sororia]
MSIPTGNYSCIICGHNAAICKTKWSSSGSLTSGNYEFIDVVRSGRWKGAVICRFSPWRKNRYVQNKWFGPYRRTMNPIPEKSSATETAAAAFRCVGFNDVVSDVNINHQFFVRTR